MNWLVKEEQLVTKLQFENQTELAQFVLRLAKHSDKVNHHADLTIRYNVLNISITTHDSGGLTEKDFELQKEIEHIKNGRLRK
ncbi:MAG: 4a-hydroxytetrahydrobiopterin dehydratase [Crocinitomicaceae bacterium]|nr:4a-hydroxytetrahydrobiopterin dehydratase [Crocinitomicaceae bacterium]